LDSERQRREGGKLGAGPKTKQRKGYGGAKGTGPLWKQWQDY